MKYIFTLFCICTALWACNEPAKKTGARETPVKAAPAGFYNGQQLTGLYMGDFGGSPIYITINYAKDRNIAGYNTHKGLRRNLSGELEKDGNGWLLKLREPGDHPFDGVFTIRFNDNFSEGKGNWQPLQADSLSEKDFVLKRYKIDDSGEGLQGYYSTEHADIFFDTDGSCLLQYYPETSPGVYAEQLQAVRGTWTSKGDTAYVSWQLNEHFGQRQSTFRYFRSADSERTFEDSLVGAGFTFTLPF